jgi:hypothetical protein
MFEQLCNFCKNIPLYLILQIFCENIRDFLMAIMIETDTGKRNCQKVMISIGMLNFPLISVYGTRCEFLILAKFCTIL